MPAQGWDQCLATAQGDGTPITNSVTQASIIPTAAKYTLAANFCNWIGQQIRVTASGRISNVVTTPGTLLFDLRFGSNVVFNNGAAAIALNIVAKTNVTWDLDLLLTVRALGSGTSSNLMGILRFTSESVVGSAAGAASSAFLPASAPAVGAGFDNTVSNTVDLQAKFSVATATTALTLHQYSLYSVN